MESILGHEAPEPFLKRLSWVDWAFSLLLLCGAFFAYSQYADYMDISEKSILFAAVPAYSWLGWNF